MMEPISLKISHTLRRFQNMTLLPAAVLSPYNDEVGVGFIKGNIIQLLGLGGVKLIR